MTAEISVTPGEPTVRPTATFALPDGTILGHYYVSLPKPLREWVLWWCRPTFGGHGHGVEAKVVIGADDMVTLQLQSSADFALIKSTLDRYMPGAVRAPD